MAQDAARSENVDLSTPRWLARLAGVPAVIDRGAARRLYSRPMDWAMRRIARVDRLWARQRFVAEGSTELALPLARATVVADEDLPTEDSIERSQAMPRARAHRISRGSSNPREGEAASSLHAEPVEAPTHAGAIADALVEASASGLGVQRSAAAPTATAEAKSIGHVSVRDRANDATGVWDGTRGRPVVAPVVTRVPLAATESTRPQPMRRDLGPTNDALSGAYAATASVVTTRSPQELRSSSSSGRTRQAGLEVPKDAQPTQAQPSRGAAHSAVLSGLSHGSPALLRSSLLPADASSSFDTQSVLTRPAAPVAAAGSMPVLPVVHASAVPIAGPVERGQIVRRAALSSTGPAAASGAQLATSVERRLNDALSGVYVATDSVVRTRSTHEPRSSWSNDPTGRAGVAVPKDALQPTQAQQSRGAAQGAVLSGLSLGSPALLCSSLLPADTASSFVLAHRAETVAESASAPARPVVRGPALPIAGPGERAQLVQRAALSSPGPTTASDAQPASSVERRLAVVSRHRPIDGPQTVAPLIWRSADPGIHQASGTAALLAAHTPLAMRATEHAPVANAIPVSTATESPTTPPVAGDIGIRDVTELAEQVSRMLARRLEIERERRGGGPCR